MLTNEFSCLADWLSKYRPSNKETMNDEQEERNVKGTILTIVKRKFRMIAIKLQSPYSTVVWPRQATRSLQM